MQAGAPRSRLRSVATRYSSALLFFGVTIGVYITRIPALTYGPGRDPDAWRMLNAGIAIAETGRYTMSRPPGHPIPEYFYSLFAFDPVPLLVLVPFIGAVGVGFFALCARRLGCRDPWIAAAAVALTPVVIINGNNLMDYTWEFAFLMAAFYFVLREKPTAAGILTGIAVGCRATAGAMLLPFSVVLLLEHGSAVRAAAARTARLWGACALTSVLCYLPVFFEYGSNALRAADEGRPLDLVLYTAGVALWGSVGIAAIVFALATLALLKFSNRRVTTSIPETLPGHHVWAWALVLVLYATLFVYLPHEAAYLLPIVPFIVLLMARYLPRWGFFIFCALLAASSFVDFDSAGIKSGPFFERLAVRRFYNGEVERILAGVERLPQEEQIILAGWMAPQLQTMWYYYSGGDRTRVTFEIEIPDSTLAARTASGREVYFLPYRNFFSGAGELRRLVGLGATPLYYKGLPGSPEAVDR